MNPGLESGRGRRLDEKIAISVALALGIPLVLILFWWRGIFPWAGSGREFWGQEKEGSPGKGSEAAAWVAPKEGESGRLGKGSPGAESAGKGLPAGGLRGLVPGPEALGNGLERVALVQGAEKSGVANSQADVEALRAELDRFRQDKETLLQTVEELRGEFAGAKMLHAKLAREALAREQQQMEQIRKLQAELNRSMAERDQFKREWERLRAVEARLKEQEERVLKLQAALEAEKKTNAELEAAGARSREELEALKAQQAAPMAAGPEGEGEARAKLQAALEAEKKKNVELEAAGARSREELEALKAQQAAPMAGGPKGAGDERAKLQAALDAEKKKNAELEAAGARSREELAALKAQQAASTGTERKAEGNELSKLRAAHAALEAEMASLRKKLQEAGKGPSQAREAAPQPGQVQAPLKAKVIERGPEGGELAKEVRGPGDVWPGALPLYQYLHQAAQEKVRAADRDEAATGKNLGRLVARVNFGHNRYELAGAERAKLESVLSAQAEGGYYLVVGYASLPGCVRQNDAISKRRAEAVAAFARGRLKAETRLQTIHLGETDQFDSEREEKNRVVEVWRVGP